MCFELTGLNMVLFKIKPLSQKKKKINTTDFYNFPEHCFINVVPTSNKILTLKALLYLKPTFSLKAKLSASVHHMYVGLSVEVQLAGKAEWKSLCCSHIFNRLWSLITVRSWNGIAFMRKYSTVPLHIIIKNFLVTFMKTPLQV